MRVDFVDISDIAEDGLLHDDHDRSKIEEKFKKEKVDGLFVPHGNFGTEYEAARLEKGLNIPVLIWGPRDECPDENGIRLRDSQCGMFATGKVLRRFGVPFTYLTNCNLEDVTFEEGIRRFLAVCNVVKTFRNIRILQIGPRPYDFWSTMCNEGELLEKFHIQLAPVPMPDAAHLPEVRDSNACFGHTDCEGLFTRPVPIHTVMGDSHAALFGQNCRSDGMIKVTYGTGSSIMMNIGHKPILSNNGLVTSLAWGLEGKPEYVLEGNLNYIGAVVSWLKDNVGIIQDVTETEALADAANKSDNLYLIPAFSGLGAPYWDSAARAAFVGMDRTTGRAELVRAALESIAYQITDIIRAMERDSQKDIGILRADGGATGNEYLMQFQSDIAGCEVSVSEMEELSGTGAAFMAGMKLGLWDEKIFDTIKRKRVLPKMAASTREYKYDGYRQAVGRMKTV